MNKKQLELKNIELEKDCLFYRDIIAKLINDYVYIKPFPKGKIKERIAVFTERNTFEKDVYITCDSVIFLNGMERSNSLILNKKEVESPK